MAREEVVANSREAWREWLQAHHATSESVWLVIYKKDSGVPTVSYPEAVEEGLCYGWVDSKPNKRDHRSYRQLFSPRNPKSLWSRKNKLTVQRLMQEGRMAPAGIDMVRRAKESGTWDALNDVENLVVPTDLQEALDKLPPAADHFQAFPRTVKRSILEWIYNAKQPATRQKRIAETATMAQQNLRANQYRQ